MRLLVLGSLAILLFLSTQIGHAQSNGKLTRVVRDTCKMYPKITAIEEMVEDLHYRKTSEDEWYCDDDDVNCATYTMYWVKYKVQTITSVDYYTGDGRLVTSAKEKSSSELMGTGRALAEGIADLEKDIRKSIFESDDLPCAESHYR